MSQQPTPPSGWYRDPQGVPVLRYWDGAHWGFQTRPLPDGVPALPQAPAPAAASPRKQYKGILWACGIAGAVIIAAVVELGLGHIGPGSSSATCTDNTCIAAELDQSLPGGVTIGGKVITSASCDPSTVNYYEAADTYSASCTIAYSDGSSATGTGNAIMSSGKVSFVPSGL